MWRDKVVALRTGLLDLLPLTWSRSIRYFFHARRFPNLTEPKGLNEKVNWRVLNDHREFWVWTCDKIAMKQHASELAPTVLIPRVLWAGMDLTELDDLQVEGRWILKPNNGSGQVIAGSGQPNVEQLERDVARWDRAFQWRTLGETAYLGASPVIVLEEWIGTDENPPDDYKFFVYDGVVRFVHAHDGRLGTHRASMYSPDWERLDANQRGILPHEHDLARPAHLEQMIEIAGDLGRDFDFIRIDLFDTPEGVWFGEFTPYPWSGSRPFNPDSFERLAGDYWVLPKASDLR